MAKQPRPTAIATPVRISPKAKRSIVEVSKSSEAWSEYLLADGTTIRVKPMIFEFMKVIGHVNQAGEPIYEARGGMIVDARVPSKLKKKVK